MLKSVKWILGSVCAVVLASGSAQAVTVNAGTLADNFFFSDSQVNAPGVNINDVYTFEYTGSPVLAATGSTTVNVNTPSSNISNFQLTWNYNGATNAGPLTQLFQTAVGGGIVTGQSLPLNLAGFYQLVITGIVTGTVQGQYDVTVQAFDRSGGNEVPLPPALVLFGSVIAGGMGLMRYRKKATAAA